MGLIASLKFFVRAKHLPATLEALSCLELSDEQNTPLKNFANNPQLLKDKVANWKWSGYIPLQMAVQKQVLDLQVSVRESAGIGEVSITSFHRDESDLLRESQDLHKDFLKLSEDYGKGWIIYEDESCWPLSFSIVDSNGARIIGAEETDRLDFLSPDQLFLWIQKKYTLLK